MSKERGCANACAHVCVSKGFTNAVFAPFAPVFVRVAGKGVTVKVASDEWRVPSKNTAKGDLEVEASSERVETEKRRLGSKNGAERGFGKDCRVRTEWRR